MKPKYSFVMPAYNAGRCIANAINSVLNQTYQNWELLIVDDGSTDNTVQEANKFHDKRIKYVKQNHLELAVARNEGINLAKGQIIVLQDADDMSLPDRLEKIDKAFTSDIDVLVHSIYVNIWEQAYGCMHREYRKAKKLDIKHLIKEQYLPGVPAFRKKVWKKCPLRQETRYAIDWMMHLDWALSGFKYKALDIGVYEYVRYQDSASQMYEKLGRRSTAFETIKHILKDEYNL